MNIGDTIKLKGISKRGKQRITTHGEEFKLIDKKGNLGGQIDLILVESLNNTWGGEKWMGWFEISIEVEIISYK